MPLVRGAGQSATDLSHDEIVVTAAAGYTQESKYPRIEHTARSLGIRPISCVALSAVFFSFVVERAGAETSRRVEVSMYLVDAPHHLQTHEMRSVESTPADFLVKVRNRNAP